MKKYASLNIEPETKTDFDALKAEVEAKFAIEDVKVIMSVDEFLKILMTVYRSSQERMKTVGAFGTT